MLTNLSLKKILTMQDFIRIFIINNLKLFSQKYLFSSILNIFVQNSIFPKNNLLRNLFAQEKFYLIKNSYSQVKSFLIKKNYMCAYVYFN